MTIVAAQAAFRQRVSGGYAPKEDSSVPLDAKRYVSPAFAEKEWEAVFGKTWLYACRVDHVAEPGDFHVTEIGRKSIIVARGSDGVVRAFYNVCRHRGNLLMRHRKQGKASTFACAYHRWEWDNDGKLRNIPDRESFPGLPDDCLLGLKPVRCEEWAGFIFFCMDPAAASLTNYLGPMVEQFDRYDLRKTKVVKDVTVEFACNWKAAMDAFNEAYHIAAVHPQLLAIAEDYFLNHECYELHSLFTIPWGVASQRTQNNAKRTGIPKALFDYANASIVGASTGAATDLADDARDLAPPEIDPASFRGTADDLSRETRRKKRERQDAVPYYPYKNLTDAELTDGITATIFPNLILNIDAEKLVLFRIRPFADDVARCYFDLVVATHLPEGADPPLPMHETGDASKDLGFVLQQDVANFWSIQAGLASGGVDELYLSDQEIRVRHFHANIDRYLEAAAPPAE